MLPTLYKCISSDFSVSCRKSEPVCRIWAVEVDRFHRKMHIVCVKGTDSDFIASDFDFEGEQTFYAVCVMARGGVVYCIRAFSWTFANFRSTVL